MARVVGIGGIFFKSPDPAKLYALYRDYLGFPAGEDGVVFTPDTLLLPDLLVSSVHSQSTLNVLNRCATVLCSISSLMI